MFKSHSTNKSDDLYEILYEIIYLRMYRNLVYTSSNEKTITV